MRKGWPSDAALFQSTLPSEERSDRNSSQSGAALPWFQSTLPSEERSDSVSAALACGPVGL